MRKFLFIIFVSVFLSGKIQAIIIQVNSPAELQSAVNKAVPGDQIILIDGTYTTAEKIIIQNQGTSKSPISISSQTIGGVTLEGTGGFVIKSPSSFIIIKGFVFKHTTGVTVIEPGATHCSITRNVFECTPLYAGTKAYLTVSGDDNEISYNTFQNKLDEGQMLSIQGPGGNKMAKRTWVHHNYFYNFPHTGKNNSSAIQIGLSGRSMDSAYSVIEYNLFIKNAGENEGILCHKACKNIIRYNTFGAGSEEVSIRHGNGSEIYGNFFLENTGLRFSGDDHLIYSNYFYKCREAIVCTNGDGEVAEGSKLTCHDRADRIQIVNNTLVNCTNNYRQPARNNGLGATRITFANNILLGGNPVSIEGLYPDAIWKGNILWNTTGGIMQADGYSIVDPKLIVDVTGVYHLSKDSPAIGKGVGNFPYVTIDIDGQKRGSKHDTGADQFSKIPATNRPLTINDVGPSAK